jgi:tRNA(Ile2) C34 agmatinyltransferase TiaS
MKGLPEYGFKCPKCGGVSAGPNWSKIERVDIPYAWCPDGDGWRSAGPDIETSDYGYRCPACDVKIENLTGCLVKLTIVAESVDVTLIRDEHVEANEHD